MAVLLMVYMALLHLYSCYAIGSSSPLCVAVYTALLSVMLLVFDGVHTVITGLFEHRPVTAVEVLPLHGIYHKLALETRCRLTKYYLSIFHI